MIESITRVEAKVIININTGLRVGRPIVCVPWDCQYEYAAELLKEHLQSLIVKHEDKLRKEAAKNPQFYLEPKELSKLKSKLVKEWDGSKHCWK